MISMKCALCNDKQKLTILYNENFELGKITPNTFSARRTPDRLHYRIVKCLICGLIFSNPIFEPDKILSLYSESYFYYKGETKHLKKTYGEYLKKILTDKEPGKIKLLDIGCGNGFFLEEAREQGIEEVYGIEPSRKTAEKALKWFRGRIKVDILKPNLFKPSTFNVVCCFHTLDHVVDPNKFLRIVFNILKKNGVAFFIVHNSNGLSVKLFGEKSPIFDIEHIFLFNSKTLTNIFLKNGFKVIKVDNLKNTYSIAYWIRMLPIPNITKSMILDFLKFTSLGLMPLSINAGNIVIIAKKN